MNIAVSFDGTCVTNDFPAMGQEVGAAEALRLLVKRGHKITMLCRRQGYLLIEALQWFKDNGIPLHHPLDEDLYISVHGVGCPLIHGDHAKPYVDWVRVMDMIDLIDKKETI